MLNQEWVDWIKQNILNTSWSSDISPIQWAHVFFRNSAFPCVPRSKTSQSSYFFPVLLRLLKSLISFSLTYLVLHRKQVGLPFSTCDIQALLSVLTKANRSQQSTNYKSCYWGSFFKNECFIAIQKKIHFPCPHLMFLEPRQDGLPSVCIVHVTLWNSLRKKEYQKALWMRGNSLAPPILCYI